MHLPSKCQTLVILAESLYCGKLGEKSKLPCTFPDPRPLPNIFSYTVSCLNFMLPDQSILELSCSQTDRQTARHTDRETNMSEY